jgi:hypothetical protein
MLYVVSSWFLVLGSWFLVLGSWFLVLGSKLGTKIQRFIGKLGDKTE